MFLLNTFALNVSLKPECKWNSSKLKCEADTNQCDIEILDARADDDNEDHDEYVEGFGDEN